MFGRSWNRIKTLQGEIQTALRADPTNDPYTGRNPQLQRFVQFWGLVGKFFWRNRCQVRASALAYTMLLALVPLLAVSLSVGSLVFDTESKESKEKLAMYIEQFVETIAPMLGLVDADGQMIDQDEGFVGPPFQSTGEGLDSAENPAEQREAIATRILEFTNQIHFGTIGVTAMIGLIFVAISLLRTIEAAFNDIWGVSRGRGWFDSIVLYWAAITLGPMVLLVAMTSGYLNVLATSGEEISTFPGIALFRSQFLPVLFLTIAFGCFYKIVPNTVVHWQPALIGGLVAGFLWWFNSKLGALYNTKVVTYSKIYGSLGAVPLFLIGLYLSWLILLFGAEVAYVYQNRQAYLQEQFSESVHPQAREFVALRFMAEIGRRFSNVQPAPSEEELATGLGVPSRLASQVLEALMAADLLVENVGDKEKTFTPARPLGQIDVRQILYALRRGQGADLATAADESRAKVQEEFSAIQMAEESRSATTTLQDLVDRLPKGLKETSEPA